MKKVLSIICVFMLIAMLTFSAMAASGVVETPVGTDGKNFKYSATLEDANITVGGFYALIVVSGAEIPTSLTADSILYIDQITATVAGSVTFTDFIPKNYSGGTAFITGTGLANPVEIGTLEKKGIVGDVNENGTIDGIDMQRLYSHLNGSNPLTTLIWADVNSNGTVDGIDMQRLYSHLNGSNPLT